MNYYFSRVRMLMGVRQQPWFRELVRHGEAYRDHAVVWKLFPGDDVPRDFVFRSLEEPGTYFIVSARAPQPSADLFEVQTKPYLPQLSEGEWLQFDLRANPTVSIRAEGGSARKIRSRRHDVLMHAKRFTAQGDDVAAAMEAAGREWIVSRASAWGIEVAEEGLQQNGYCQHRLRHKGRRIEFSSLEYRGLVRVKDAALLRTALLEGVGHARGFGCGLVLVRRAN